MHVVPDPVPNPPLTIGLALGARFDVKADLAADYDNIIHWYIVPDDRAFLPIRTVFFPKSEDKFGVLGSDWERVGRNQYAPRLTDRRVRRRRIMQGGAKIRDFGNGFDFWGYDGTHYHGDQEDFLGRASRYKYWINGVAPALPCPGVPTVPVGLRLVMQTIEVPVINEATLTLQFAMLLDQPYNVSLQLAMYPYPVAGTDAAFKKPLQLAMFVPAAGGKDLPFMQGLRLDFLVTFAGGIDKPFVNALQLGFIDATAGGTDTPFVNGISLGFAIAMMEGTDAAFVHGLKLTQAVAQAGGIDLPFRSGLKLAADAYAHMKPFDVEEARMQMAFTVPAVTGQDAAMPVAVTFAQDVAEAGGIDRPFTHALRIAMQAAGHVTPFDVLELRLPIAFVAASASGIDLAFQHGLKAAMHAEAHVTPFDTNEARMKMAFVVAFASGVDASMPFGLQVAMAAEAHAKAFDVEEARLQLAFVVAESGEFDAAVTMPLQLAFVVDSAGVTDAPFAMPLKLAFVVPFASGSDASVPFGLQMAFVVASAGVTDEPFALALKLATVDTSNIVYLDVSTHALQLGMTFEVGGGSSDPVGGVDCSSAGVIALDETVHTTPTSGQNWFLFTPTVAGATYRLSVTGLDPMANCLLWTGSSCGSLVGPDIAFSFPHDITTPGAGNLWLEFAGFFMPYSAYTFTLTRIS